MTHLPTSIRPDVTCGSGVTIITPSNLYGCTIGHNVFIGPFVEIQKNAFIDDDCRIQSHTFVCEGVSIGKRCFIAHGVMFVNDKYPIVNNPNWKPFKTIIEDDVNIGSNATILPVYIGKGATIGAGAVVTKDVRPGAVVVGNPAHEISHR